MIDEWFEVTAFILGILIGAAVTMMVFGGIVYDGFKKEAIEPGVAEYNQTTGKWQWKELDKINIQE